MTFRCKERFDLSRYALNYTQVPGPVLKLPGQAATRDCSVLMRCYTLASLTLAFERFVNCDKRTDSST